MKYKDTIKFRYFFSSWADAISIVNCSISSKRVFYKERYMFIINHTLSSTKICYIKQKMQKDVLYSKMWIRGVYTSKIDKHKKHLKKHPKDQQAKLRVIEYSKYRKNPESSPLWESALEVYGPAPYQQMEYV